MTAGPCLGQKNQSTTPFTQLASIEEPWEKARTEGGTVTTPRLALLHTLRGVLIPRGGGRCPVAGGDGAALVQASSKALGGVAWDEFSGVCWLFGRDIHDALGKRQTGALPPFRRVLCRHRQGFLIERGAG